MAYKRKTEQVKSEQTKNEQGSTKGITQCISVGLPDIPAPGALTKEEIATYVRNLTADQAKTILDSWADGQGTGYQQDLAKTGRAYG